MKRMACNSSRWKAEEEKEEGGGGGGLIQLERTHCTILYSSLLHP
jgi:hypothetical protein